MTTRAMRLERISFAAQDINFFTFAPLDGAPLPAAEAGAHVDLHLRADLIRQYSLAESDEAPRSYTIGVKREANGRGGSRHVHDSLRVGQVIELGLPRNNFPLKEDADHSVLIAGGIGITPIWAMAQRLTKLGRSWKMYVSARSKDDCALYDQLVAMENVHIHLDDAGQGFLDLAGVVAAAPAGSHFYCCGPAPMLQAYRTACEVLPATHVHDEAFALPTLGGANDGEFTVKLAQSGQEIAIPADQSILDALRAAGIDAMSSCEAGVCGMCETRVLSGEVDHRDHVLSADEQASNSRMMICCSRARSAELVLDL